jgi:hypothetical protein
VTTSSLSPRDRRAIAVGGAILLPALLYIWAVRPYRAALDDARERLASERAALARERAAVLAAHRNPQLQRVADSAMAVATPRLFTGRDDVMASAELTTYLGDVASASHVWLQDAATRPAVTSAGGVRTLHVEMRGESDLQGILTFLEAIEDGTKLVRVDRLDIARVPRVSDDDNLETLSVSATIAGFAIVEEPAAGTNAPGPSKAVASRARDNP